MKFNTKKIFLIAGGVLILLAVFLLIFTRQTSREQHSVDGQATSPTPQEEKPAVLASKEETDKINVLVLASSFAERFGSFSSQSDFQNIKDLFPFMTASMRSWAEDYIEIQKANVNSEVYSGVSTKALSKKFLSFNENSVEVLIGTQRREFAGTMANEKITYQDIELKLIKIGEEWNVDGVWWK